MHNLFGLLVLAALFLPVMRAHAQDFVACVHAKKGTMRIVTSADACIQGKETAVAWNAVGPQGPPGLEGPQGAAGAGGPPGGFRVVDVNGHEIGPLVSELDGSFLVFVPSVQRTVKIDGLYGELGSGSVYFDEPGCNGQAFVQADVPHHISFYPPNRYFVGRAVPVEVETVESRLVGNGTCQDIEPFDHSGIPADEVQDIGIDLPLALPLFVLPASGD